MDFLVRVTKRFTQIIFASILGIIFSFSNAHALGDISVIYSYAFNYFIYFLVIVAISTKLKYGERFKSICVFIICFILDLVVSAKIPFSRFKFFILMFSLINLTVLVVYVWMQIKFAIKNRRKH